MPSGKLPSGVICIILGQKNGFWNPLVDFLVAEAIRTLFRMAGLILAPTGGVPICRSYSHPPRTVWAGQCGQVLWAAGGIPSGWICLYFSASAGVGPVSDWWNSSCGELSVPF